MQPDCQLRAFNAEVTDSFTIALSPCSHSCPLTLVPSFGNDREGCCGWCISLSFHDTSSPRTWRSSTISPNSFEPSLAILGRFTPRPGPLGLIVEMGRGTQILWPHSKYYETWNLYFPIFLSSFFFFHLLSLPLYFTNQIKLYISFKFFFSFSPPFCQNILTQILK